MSTRIFASSFIPAIAVSVVFALSGLAQEASSNPPATSPGEETFFVDCRVPRMLSPVSLADNKSWSAYVEVTTASDCMHTTRLWVNRGKEPYRLVYLMPPMREAVGNGMQILGWAEGSRLLLVKTEYWQDGSDAQDMQRVLAIDAGTGLVYEPNLNAMLDDRKDKQCAFRVEDAGFGDDKGFVILVRARIFTDTDVDENEGQIDPAKRCGNSQELWSFYFATAARVPDSTPLKLFKSFVPNRVAE